VRRRRISSVSSQALQQMVPISRILMDVTLLALIAPDTLARVVMDILELLCPTSLNPSISPTRRVTPMAISTVSSHPRPPRTPGTLATPKALPWIKGMPRARLLRPMWPKVRTSRTADTRTTRTLLP
jgi:hypothetical protein